MSDLPTEKLSGRLLYARSGDSETLMPGVALAQRPVNKSKRLVFHHRDGFVYKGPYKPGSKVYEKMLYRTSLFSKWQTPCVLLPLAEVVAEDGIFFRFEDLSKDRDGKKRKPNRDEHDIVSWPHFGKLSNALKADKTLLERLDCDLLLGYCHLYLDGVGDVGLHNTVYNTLTEEAWIIDYEESRMMRASAAVRKRPELDFYFKKAVASSLHWEEYVKRVVDYTLDQLELLTELTDTQNEKLTMARSYLEQLATEPRHSEKDKVDVVRLGKMRLLTSMAAITYSGFTTAEMKSGYQKYQRRGEVMLAIRCVVELWRMRELGRKALRWVTNLCNRILISSMEDIGPANMEWVIFTAHWRVCIVNTDPTDLQDHAYNGEDEDEKVELAMIIALIEKLCEGNKTRLMSHLRAAYTTDLGRKLLTEAGRKVDIVPQVGDSDLSLDEGQLDTELRQVLAESPLRERFHQDDPLILQQLAIVIDYKLAERDANVISWLYLFLEVGDRFKIAARIGRYKAAAILWDLVFRSYLSPEAWQALSNAYFKLNSESDTVLLTLITYILYLHDSAYGSEPLAIDLAEYEQYVRDRAVDWLDRGLEGLLAGKYKLVLADYVKDFHAGYKTSRQNFALEGAKVIPQDPQLHDPVLESIYIALKVAADSHA